MPLRHWGMNQLFRMPVPVFDHPFGKEMLPNIRSQPLLAQLCSRHMLYTQSCYKPKYPLDLLEGAGDVRLFDERAWGTATPSTYR